MATEDQKPLFRDITAEDPDPEVTEIESFCVNCHANVSKYVYGVF